MNDKIHVRPVGASITDLPNLVDKDSRTPSTAPTKCIEDKSNKNKFYFRSTEINKKSSARDQGLVNAYFASYGLGIETAELEDVDVKGGTEVSGTGMLIVNINDIPMFKGKSSFSWGGVNISKTWPLKLRKSKTSYQTKTISTDTVEGFIISLYYECAPARIVL